jgi:hypothetical protein
MLIGRKGVIVFENDEAITASYGRTKKAAFDLKSEVVNTCTSNNDMLRREARRRAKVLALPKANH